MTVQNDKQKQFLNITYYTVYTQTYVAKSVYETGRKIKIAFKTI